MLILMMVPRGMVGVTVVVSRSERGAVCTSFVLLKYMRKDEKCYILVFFGFIIKVFSSQITGCPKKNVLLKF